MRVAIACRDSRLGSDVAEHFGRAPAYVIYDTASGSVTKLASGFEEEMPPDGGLNAAVTLLDSNVDAVIAGRFGHRVTEFFEGANVILSQAAVVAGSLALDRFLREHEGREATR
jgi:predicted Fe-Mo cluster-binding NifX family protein